MSEDPNAPTRAPSPSETPSPAADPSLAEIHLALAAQYAALNRAPREGRAPTSADQQVRASQDLIRRSRDLLNQVHPRAS